MTDNEDRTPRCESVDGGGYQCELLDGHPMPHRAIIGATDEHGPVPERQWGWTAPNGSPPLAGAPPFGLCRTRGDPLNENALLRAENAWLTAALDAARADTTPHLPPYFFVFDVESVGLHGGAFAIGFVVLDTTTGEFSRQDRAWCDPANVRQDTTESRIWITEHIPLFDEADRCESALALREWFWRNWIYAKSLGAVMAADVAWPVEARFLLDCIADDPAARLWDGPYPLVDIASVRLACGHDPLATEARKPNELPQHDPMMDARQSARLLWEAIAARTQPEGSHD